LTDKRRSRRSGTSPGGRDTRKAARSEGTRRASRFLRAPEGKPNHDTDRDRPPRVVNRTKKEQKPERTILGLSTGRAVILAVVVCALGLTLAVPARTYFTQRADAAQVASERLVLEHDLDVLRSKQKQQKDPEYIRAQARDRLRLVMPGETPFQVQLPGAYEAEQAKRKPPPPEGGPWYSDLYKQISEPQPAQEPAG